jgi:ParB-like chromosome segregation protein Spo0J
VEEIYSNEADRVLSMITRNSGKPLSMLEQAEVVKRLAAFGWDKKKIASKAGKSVQHIENILVLAGSPEELKKQVAQGDVSASNAVSLTKKHGDKASEVVKGAVEKTGKKITARQTATSAERGKISKWIAEFYPGMHEAFLSEFPVED